MENRRQSETGKADSASTASKTAASAGATGIAASGAELGAGKTTVGSNGKVYPNGFQGNQHVTTISVAKTAELAGRATVVVSVAADSVQLANGEMSIGKFAMNRTMDGVGMFGGPPGALTAGAYYSADTFYPGGFGSFAHDAGRAQMQMECICSKEEFDSVFPE
jgi:hypothetical protein